MKTLQKITITVLLLCAVLPDIHAQGPPTYQAYVLLGGPTNYCGTATGTLSAKNSADGTAAPNIINWEEGANVSTNPDGSENFTVINTISQVGNYNFSLAPGDTKYYRATVMVQSSTVKSKSIRLTSEIPPVAGTLTGAASFMDSGSGSLTYTGGTGTVQWISTPRVDEAWHKTQYVNLVNGNYTVNQTTDFQVRRYNPNGSACSDAYTQTVTVEVYSVGTISAPTSTVEGSRITLNVYGAHKSVIQWETSIDGGSTWSIINFPYNSMRYEVVANTTFRALIDLGPFGSGYTPSVTVTYSPYTQFDHPLVYGNNSVKEQAVTVKNITDPFSVNTLSTYQKQEAISYLDGHGRAIQQNLRSASPLQKDIVTFTDYDRIGRQPVQYQPYVSTSSDGLYKNDPFGEQLSFYTNPVEDKIANNTQPFAVSLYESSPVGRLTEQGSPGSFWQPGGGHTKIMTYANNAASDVRQFNTDGTSSGFYAVNQLSLSQGTDEDGKKKQVYTDTQGRTILSRTQLDETVGGVYNSWLETYYIYNDRNAIRYIVSPNGVAALKANGWQLNASIKTQYAHELVYDARGRVVQKKVPGQDWMYYCYDRFDRLTLAQDGKLRTSNNWIFFKYDKKGRLARQGLYTDNTNTSLSAMQGVIDPLYANATDIFFEDDPNSNYCFPTTGTTNHVLNSYDNTTQSYAVQGLPNEGTPGPTTGLLTSSSRLVLGTSLWITSYYFYDMEGRLIQELSNNHLSQTLDNLKTYVYDFSGKVKQLKTYHHAGTQTVTTLNRYFYDQAGRVKQVYQKNNTDPEVLLVDYRYNELGQLVEKNLHCTTCTSPDPSIGEGSSYGTGTITRSAYNSTESTLIASQQILLEPGFDAPGSSNFNAKIAQSVTDIEATYNTSGQFLQSVDLRYDVRGNLASINNAQLNVNSANNDDTNDYFGMEFLYENGLTSGGLYNGNMSAVKWKSLAVAAPGATDQQSYQYTYDKANRLRSAISQVFDGTAWAKETNAQNESMTYDLNGNIQLLQRNGRSYNLAMVSGKLTSSYAQGLIDDLTYTYNTNLGDQLLRVTDAASKAGFDNGASAAVNDYTYDGNGNVQSDLNKGINGITYNHLGKPTQINFSDGRQINYVYDAGGNKLTMSSKAADNTVTTNDYVGSFVYTNSNLSFFSSPEGRVVKNATGLEYQYALADNQGNTRLVFTSAAPVADVKTATFETANQSAEASQFSNYGHISAGHATTTPGNAQYLNGSATGMIGVAKSYPVFPGDQLKIEAYGSYNVLSGSSNLANIAGALLSAFNLTPPIAGEVGTAASAINNWGGLAAGGYGDGTNDAADPKAFVNIVLFDKNYNFLDVAYAQLKGSSLYYMTASYTVKEAGYAYLYVSNEQATQTDVYFDDVKMTYTPTNIIQYNEYYPYGLQTSTSWTRNNSSNNFLYNDGSELNQTSGWYETAFRGYDPALGRFHQVDPQATTYSSLSGYHYSFNNPVMFNDPTGADPNNPDPGSMNNYGNAWMDAMIAAMDQAAMDAIGMGDSYRDQRSTANYMANVRQQYNNMMASAGYVKASDGNWYQSNDVYVVPRADYGFFLPGHPGVSITSSSSDEFGGTVASINDEDYLTQGEVLTQTDPNNIDARFGKSFYNKYVQPLSDDFSRVRSNSEYYSLGLGNLIGIINRDFEETWLDDAYEVVGERYNLMPVSCQMYIADPNGKLVVNTGTVSFNSLNGAPTYDNPGLGILPTGSPAPLQVPLGNGNTINYIITFQKVILN